MQTDHFFMAGHRTGGCSAVKPWGWRASLPASQTLAGHQAVSLSCEFRDLETQAGSLFDSPLSLPVRYPCLFSTDSGVQAESIPDSEWDVSAQSNQKLTPYFGQMPPLWSAAVTSPCVNLLEWVREWTCLRPPCSGEGCNSSWIRPTLLSPFIKGRNQNFSYICGHIYYT